MPFHQVSILFHRMGEREQDMILATYIGDMISTFSSLATLGRSAYLRNLKRHIIWKLKLIPVKTLHLNSMCTVQLQSVKGMGNSILGSLLTCVR